MRSPINKYHAVDFGISYIIFCPGVSGVRCPLSAVRHQIPRYLRVLESSTTISDHHSYLQSASLGSVLAI